MCQVVQLGFLTVKEWAAVWHRKIEEGVHEESKQKFDSASGGHAIQ